MAVFTGSDFAHKLRVRNMTYFGSYFVEILGYRKIALLGAKWI